MKVCKQVTNMFKNMDKKILIFMEKGITLSSLFCIIGILFLLVYKNSYITYDLVEGSIILFRTSLFFVVQFFICGIAMDKISKMNT